LNDDAIAQPVLFPDLVAKPLIATFDQAHNQVSSRSCSANSESRYGMSFLDARRAPSGLDPVGQLTPGRMVVGASLPTRQPVEACVSERSNAATPLKQEEGLQARVRKRYKTTTNSDHDQPVADNLLQQNFTAERPNQRWVGDTSELRIGEQGKAYLAVILDLFSRFVVGWAISAVNDRHLTIKALEMALKRRAPGLGLLHHSDQGSTYASEDYQDVLTAAGITCSMSRRGNCYDNAVMEAFFSTVKNEVGERFASHADAKAELFGYLEVFHNQRRRHSSSGRMSPAAFERRTTQAA
jgi:transposase InsO family protein